MDELEDTKRLLHGQLLKIVQEFHIRFDYDDPTGIVEETWRIYERLEPEDYDDAKKGVQELRMVLPGTKPGLSPSRRASLVFRVVGAVISSLGAEPPSRDQLRQLVSAAARDRKAPDELAEQLADFLPEHLPFR